MNSSQKKSKNKIKSSSQNKSGHTQAHATAWNSIFRTRETQNDIKSSDNHQNSWTKVEILLLLIFLVIITLIYTWTLWPHLPGGDSGELVAAICSRGTIHPPGYPLYTMLGIVFSWIPIGNMAWKINLMSAIFSISAYFILYLNLRKWRCISQSKNISILSLSFLSLTPLIWRYSVAAEVFSLNVLFSSLLIWIWSLALTHRHIFYLYLFAFIFGMSLSHHHTILFLGAPLGLYLLYTLRTQIAWIKDVVIGICLLSLGLTPYLYLYWASNQNPLIAWGDLTNWQGFFTHLLRKEYGTFQLATSGTEQFQLFWGLYYFAKSWITGYLFIGVLPLFFGLRKTLLNKWIEPLFLTLVGLLYLIIFHILANLPFVDGAPLYLDIVSRFWLMPYILLVPMFTIGLGEIAQHIDHQIKPWLEKFRKNELSNPLALTLIMLAFPLMFSIHFKNEDHSNNDNFARFGQSLLKNLPENAVYFSLGDINTNTTRYLQVCENYRTDVKILDRSLMSYPWFKRIANTHFPQVVLPGRAYHPRQFGDYDLKKLFDANIGRNQIFITNIKSKDSVEAFDKAWENSYRLTPYGLTYRVSRAQNSSEPLNAAEVDSYIKDSESFLVDPIAVFNRPPQKGTWDAVIQSNYWVAHHSRAAEILKFGIKTLDIKYLELANKLLEDLVTKNPDPPPDYFKNLGVARQHLGRVTTGSIKSEHERRMLEAWEIFIHRTDRRDKTYQDIRSVLKAYGRLSQ